MPELIGISRLMNPRQVPFVPVGGGTDHILLEDGTDLLLEDGSLILLETA